MKMDIKKYKSPLLVIVICFIAFFVNNDVIVPDIMESRNSVTAREMVYDGHWIVPTMKWRAEVGETTASHMADGCCRDDFS